MRRPLFLARRAYRLRRLTDAARLLPVVGTFLFLLPVFWRGADGMLPGTATGGVYLFAVWGGLILATALIARRLEQTEAQDGGEEDGRAQIPEDLDPDSSAGGASG